MEVKSRWKDEGICEIAKFCFNPAQLATLQQFEKKGDPVFGVGATE